MSDLALWMYLVTLSLFGLFDGVVLIPPSSLATSSRRARRCIVTPIVEVASGSLSSDVSGIHVPDGGSGQRPGHRQLRHGLSRVAREHDADHGADPEPGAQPHRAAMQVGERPCDRKPQS